MWRRRIRSPSKWIGSVHMGFGGFNNFIYILPLPRGLWSNSHAGWFVLHRKQPSLCSKCFIGKQMEPQHHTKHGLSCAVRVGHPVARAICRSRIICSQSHRAYARPFINRSTVASVRFSPDESFPTFERAFICYVWRLLRQSAVALFDMHVKARHKRAR